MLLKSLLEAAWTRLSDIKQSYVHCLEETLLRGELKKTFQNDVQVFVVRLDKSDSLLTRANEELLTSNFTQENAPLVILRVLWHFL
jgi:hypothetical protein